MKRTELLQEIRKMRFEEAYQGWSQKRFTQEEAARFSHTILSVSPGAFNIDDLSDIIDFCD